MRFFLLTVLAMALTGCTSEAPAPVLPFAERTIQIEPRHYGLEVDIDVDGRRLDRAVRGPCERSHGG